MLQHPTFLEIHVVADFNLGAWWHGTKDDFIIKFDIGPLTDEFETCVGRPGGPTVV